MVEAEATAVLTTVATSNAGEGGGRGGFPCLFMTNADITLVRDATKREWLIGDPFWVKMKVKRSKLQISTTTQFEWVYSAVF